MNIKLILTGLSIIFLNIAVSTVAVMQIHIAHQTIMVLLIVVSLLLWFYLLRKDIPLGIRAIDLDTSKFSVMLFIIPIGISLYLLLTAEIVNFSRIVFLFITSLIVAVYEEILFRLIGLGTLLNARIAPAKAIIVSSIIFSVSHAIYNPVMSLSIIFLLLNTFMMGFIIGYIYHKTYNLLFVIAIHLVWDFTVFINQRLASEEIGLVTTALLYTITLLYFSWSYRRVKYI